MDAPSKVACGA